MNQRPNQNGTDSLSFWENGVDTNSVSDTERIPLPVALGRLGQHRPCRECVRVSLDSRSVVCSLPACLGGSRCAFSRFSRSKTDPTSESVTTRRYGMRSGSMRILVKSTRVPEGRRSAFLRLPRAEGNKFRCYSTGCGNLGHRSGDLAGLRHGEYGHRRSKRRRKPCGSAEHQSIFQRNAAIDLLFAS